MDPITDVFLMAGLHNTTRRLVVDGTPVSYPQLRVAGCYDPVAFRAFWKINGMVCPPEDV
jgi:hypothetical protein